MYDIFENIEKWKREMEKSFQRIFNQPFFKEPLISKKEFKNFTQPLSDIRETDNNLIITVDLPGVEKKDIQLKVTENTIEIKAERSHKEEQKKKGYYKLERSYGGFYRALTLPCKIKPEKAKAELKNGVLKITLPKKEKLVKIKAKTIKVK